jgi:GT2 family glycosyltransferase
VSNRTVTVVVPVFNGADIIGDCLASIPPGVETIVVDDASTDGAPDVVASGFPGARLLRNERNLGFAATANVGLNAASGDVRVVLNSDARLREGALVRLDAAFDDTGVGIAGPRLVFPDGSHQVSAARFPTVGSFVAGAFALNELYRRLLPRRRFRWELGLSRADHDRSADVDWVHGTCLAISRECFEATGGFDPGYRMYVEECDLCWRAHRADWRVRYVADAVVEHIGAASGGGDPARQATYNLAGEARFMARAYGADVLPKWRAARLVSSAVKVVVLAPLSLFDRRLRKRLRWHATAVRVLWRNAGLTEDPA